MDLSVVIPTRNRPALLAEAIDSILRQDLAVPQVVVVVDGPDPTSARVARDLGCLVVEHDRSKGEGAARNAGVEAATGAWVAFLDDDDLWHPELMSTATLYLAAHPDCDALNAGFWTFGPAGSGADLVADRLDQCLAEASALPSGADMSYLQITGRSFDMLLERNRGAISTAVVRRSLLRAAGGFPEGLTCAADWVMFLNVARLTEWHVIDRRLSFVRRHAGQNTGANPTNGVVALQAIADVWADERPTPSHRSLADYGRIYRWHVQDSAWTALRRRRIDLARTAWRIGHMILPRRSDRLYAYLPPQLTYRLDRRRRGPRLRFD